MNLTEFRPAIFRFVAAEMAERWAGEGGSRNTRIG